MLVRSLAKLILEIATSCKWLPIERRSRISRRRSQSSASSSSAPPRKVKAVRRRAELTCAGAVAQQLGAGRSSSSSKGCIGATSCSPAAPAGRLAAAAAKKLRCPPAKGVASGGQASLAAGCRPAAAAPTTCKLTCRSPADRQNKEITLMMPMTIVAHLADDKFDEGNGDQVA